MSIIHVENISKRYASRSRKSPDVFALNGLSFDVEEGTVRGILGPNGAGKTTAIKILTTLVKPTSGRATVAGYDVVRDAATVRTIFGASGQYATIDEDLTARENLMLVGRLFHLGEKKARQRAEELLERFSLQKAADRPVKGFSGGMRRRADLAASLVNDPRILFLDEPTTGLDPVARLALWDVIRERVSDGTTLLLTTQYLEEADQLADSISVVDNGRVIAEGTPDELKSRVGGQRLSVTLVNVDDLDSARALMNRLAHHADVRVTDRTLTVPVEDGPTALESLVGSLRANNIEVHDLGMDRPTLDDVFLTLTGETADDAATDSVATDTPEDHS